LACAPPAARPHRRAASSRQPRSGGGSACSMASACGRSAPAPAVAYGAAGGRCGPTCEVGPAHAAPRPAVSVRPRLARPCVSVPKLARPCMRTPYALRSGRTTLQRLLHNGPLPEPASLPARVTQARCTQDLHPDSIAPNAQSRTAHNKQTPCAAHAKRPVQSGRTQRGAQGAGPALTLRLAGRLLRPPAAAAGAALALGGAAARGRVPGPRRGGGRQRLLALAQRVVPHQAGCRARAGARSAASAA